MIPIIIAIVAFSSFYVPEAYGYIDPGTGSYILQMIIAIVVGALFGIKIFFNKIKSFFTNLFFGNREDERVEK